MAWPGSPLEERERIRGILEKHGVKHRFITVSSARTVDDAARSLGINRDRIAKTMIVMTERGPVAVFLRGVDRANIDKLKRSLGLRSGRLASPCRG